MAPLPDNNTPVLFVVYTSGGTEHTAEVRLPSNATTTTAATAAAALAATMQNYMLTSDSVLRARFRAANSTVSVPISLTALSGTVAGTVDPDKKANYASFTGRSTDGRDVKFTMFTNIISIDASGFRDRTPSAAESAILAILQNSSVDARTISGLAPLWNSYINYGVNAYWQRKLRRTY